VSQMPVEAAVVLTSDNTQYDQSMTASAAQTDNLAKSVDSLSSKINSMAKSAGRKMIGLSMADTALIVATTAAYAAWEKQMTSLNVQAAVLNRGVTSQKRMFNEYAREVNAVRREYGQTTTAAAALVQTINKLSDSTAPADKLTASFSKLGEATQESSTMLATSMLQLQRTMGTAQRETDKYNNQLVVLQSRSNSSAQGILEFANSIAPVGRLVNMTQTDIMGFSNAFIKAGQDGYQASNVFSKMLSNIAYATQSGSPELAKYANLVGMTTANFKELSGTDKYLKIFDAINQQGPRAITTLNRMGLDGMRTVRTVTAMAQQGGMAAEIEAARNADPNAMNRGAEASMKGLIDSSKRLRAELAQTGEAFGKNYAGPMRFFVDGLTKISGAIRDVAESPLGSITAWVIGLAAPLALLTGGLLKGASALMAFSTARGLLTGAFAGGFKETGALSVAQMAEMDQRGLLPGVGAGRAWAAGSPVARDVAERGSWTNRMAYNMGSSTSRLLGYRAGAATNIASQAAGWTMYGAGAAANNLITPQYSGGQMGRITSRMRFFGAATPSESFGFGPEGRWGAARTVAADAFVGRYTVPGPHGGKFLPDDAQAAQAKFDELKAKYGDRFSDKTMAATAEASVRRASETARGVENLGKAAMTAEKGLGHFGRGMAGMMTMMAGSAATMGKIGASLGSQLFSLVGGNYVLAGGAAIYGGYKAIQAATGDVDWKGTSYTGFANTYLQQAGAETVPNALTQYNTGAGKPNLTTASALQITSAEAMQAREKGYQFTNPQMKDIKTTTQAKALVSAQWPAMKSNPQALASMVSDLLANENLSTGDVQDVIAYAQKSGDSGLDLTALTQAAARPGSQGFWDTVRPNQSGSLAQENLDVALSAMKDRGDLLAQTQGTQAQMDYLGKTTNQLFSSFQKEVDKPADRSIFGEKGFGESGDVFIKAMGEQVLGISRTQQRDKLGGDYETYIKGGGQITDVEEFLKYAWDTSKFAKDRVTDEQRMQTYDKYGIAHDTSKEEAAKIIADQIANPTVLQPSERDSAQGKITSFTEDLFGPKGILNLASVKNALENGAEDVNAQYEAINDVWTRIQTKGGSAGEQMKYLLSLNASGMAFGDSSMGADIWQGALAKVQQQQAFESQFQGRTQNVKQRIGTYQGIMNAPLGPEGLAVRDQENQSFQQFVGDQQQWITSLLYQQREFDVSRRRAQEDYNLQVEYAQEDFALSRARSEQDYQLMRARAEDDYAKQLKRTISDYGLSRKREEQDHHHSVMLMVEQQAQAMYNVYERVNVQRTSSSSWLLVNAKDQLERMQKQTADLENLRKMGVSDNVIQQLGLTDPDKAQQLSRFASEMEADPSKIKDFNKAIRARLKAARDVVTDSSSTEWEEFTRSYRLARSRAQEDFDKSLRRSRQDFKLSLSRQDDDFRRSLNRQEEDYAKMMSRQEDAYTKAMTRGAEDLNRSSKAITGSLMDLLEKGSERLSGHAKKQVDIVIAQFKNLKAQTSPYAVEVMTTLAAVFGVKYTPPKLSEGPGLGHATSGQTDTGFGPAEGYAFGGTVPGWSPGRDTRVIAVGGGESVMRPEWTRAVGGPKAVDAMNSAAIRGFAHGGVVDPDGRTYMDGEPVSRITKAQLLLAEKLSKMNFSTMQGSWQPYSSYSGTSHMGAGVVDESPGSFMTQYWMRRVGFAAWARNIPGAAYAGSGPHVHAISRLDPGARHHAQLSSFARGEDGLGGPDYGPNPPLVAGLMGMLAQFSDLELASGSPGSATAALSSILKRRYPRAERAAAGMSGVHPLQEGDISHIINKAARVKYHDMRRSGYGDGSIFTAKTAINVGERGPEMVLPLNDAGLDYLARLMSRLSGGLDSKMNNVRGSQPVCSHNEYHYQIDRSTNFTGPITVQANNPQDLLNSLRARSRVMALSQPVLGGTR
jgi:TP901 family phage tail tape measure protein